MPSLFVDTAIWRAEADSSDAGNPRAKAVLGAGEPLVTSDHVLIETWTLLRHRIRRQIADRFWESLRSGVSVIGPVGAADLETAWQIGISWRDQDFSIVDRTSFAINAPARHRMCGILRCRLRYLPFRSQPAPRFYDPALNYKP